MARYRNTDTNDIHEFVDGSYADRRAADDPDVWEPFEAGQEPQSDDRPAKSANKDAWVDHAVAQGWDRDTADSHTKEQLIQLFGGDS